MFEGKEIVEIGRFVDDEIVSIEHAQKINELDMCLEEYVEFLENNNS